MCRFNINTNNWTKESTSNKLGESEGGQSTIIGDSIYYLFGHNSNEIFSKIYQLNTTKINDGWIDITSRFINLNNCSSIASFGILSFNDLILFYGGITETGSKNSLNVIDLNKNTLWCQNSSHNPTPRSDGRSVQVSNFFIVFAGKDANSYYNDLWVYQVDNSSDNWKIINANGAYPSPRIGHSMCSQGNYVLLVGGINAENIFTSDYWLLEYKSETFVWKEIIPLSESPPPISNTCVMFDMPVFYYAGGFTPLGAVSDIWMYNLSTNAFKKIYTNSSMNGFFGHGCHFDKNTNSLYTFYGSLSKSEIPYCFINKFNIQDLNNVQLVSQDKAQKMKCRAYFAYTHIGDDVFIAGGQSYLTEAFNDIWKINFEHFSEEKIGDMDSPLYKSSFVSIGRNYYLFSGLINTGYYDHMNPSSSLRVINLNSYINSTYCGRGFYYDYSSNNCAICEPGFWSDKSDIESIPCRPGTYNPLYGGTDFSQCLPCPIGTYTNQSGSKQCEKCYEGCFPGSTSQSLYDINSLETYYSKQFPSLISPEVNYTFRLALLICLIILVFLFSIGFAFSKKLKVACSVNDLFQKRHIDRPEVEEDDSEMNLTEGQKSNISFIGGFFTGIALILFAVVLTYFLYLLICENRLDTVSLVPTTTIIKKSGFKEKGITIKMAFQSYRGDCTRDEIIAYPSTGIKVYNFQISRPKSYNETICEIEFKLRKYSNNSEALVFDTNDYVLVSFSGTNSYTSDMSIAIESESAYKGKISQYPVLLKQSDGLVFKGNNPSIFQFELMPAYFENIKYSYTSNEYGYRVSQFDMPQVGSLTSLNEFYLNKGFSIQVNLIISQSGVYTISNFKNDIAASVGLILGVLSGTIGLITLTMNIFECAYFYKIRKREVGKKSVYEIEVERLERLEKIKSIRNSKAQGSIN